MPIIPQTFEVQKYRAKIQKCLMKAFLIFPSIVFFPLTHQPALYICWHTKDMMNQ